LLRNETFIKSDLYLRTLIDTFDTGDEGQEAREEDIRQKFVIGVFFTTVVGVAWSIYTARTKRTRKIMELRAEYIGWKTPNGLKQDVRYLQRALAYNSKLAYFVVQYDPIQDGKDPAREVTFVSEDFLPQPGNLPPQGFNQVDQGFVQAFQAVQRCFDLTQTLIKSREEYATISGLNYTALQKDLDSASFYLKQLSAVRGLVKEAIVHNGKALRNFSARNIDAQSNDQTVNLDNADPPLARNFQNIPNDRAFLQVHGALRDDGLLDNFTTAVQRKLDEVYRATTGLDRRRGTSPARRRPGVRAQPTTNPTLSLASVTIRTLPRPRSVVDEVFAKHKDGGF
jgi:hypothetical protein